MISISGAVREDFKDYIRPLAKRNPTELIIHCGTNDFFNSKIDTVKNIKDIVQQIRQYSPATRVRISSLTYRGDTPSINVDIDMIKKELFSYCKANNIGFIDNNNITLSELNASLLHLNKHAGGLPLVTNSGSSTEAKILYNYNIPVRNHPQRQRTIRRFPDTIPWDVIHI